MEANLEEVHLPSEVTASVQVGSMDEDTKHVPPTESRGMERWTAVVVGIFIVPK